MYLHVDYLSIYQGGGIGGWGGGGGGGVERLEPPTLKSRGQSSLNPSPPLPQNEQDQLIQ